MISLHIYHLCSPFVHACVVSKETTRNKGLIDGIVADVLSTRLLQVSVVPGVLLKFKCYSKKREEIEGVTKSGRLQVELVASSALIWSANVVSLSSALA